MYSITLEINQKCNLRCKYCYLGEKDNSTMDIRDAINSIDLGIEQVKMHKDKTLVVNFVGGEATIDFNFLKKVVSYSKDICNEDNINIVFTVTTNALLLNEEMMSFFIENRFLLKVSIDGNKEINDLNRITGDDKGSYEKIIEKLELLRNFERKTKHPVQVTNVITKNNYKEYYNSLVHITKDLGFKVVDTAINLYEKWSYEEYKVIEESIYKSFDYFIERHKCNEPFSWSFLTNARYLLEKRKKIYSCGGGIISIHVKNNGEFYSCPVSTIPDNALGNAKDGLNMEKIEELKNIDKINNYRCKNCSIYDYCGGKSCIMLNLEINGDKNKPVDMVCWLEKLRYNFIREKEEIMRETFGGDCYELIRS